MFFPSEIGSFHEKLFVLAQLINDEQRIDSFVGSIRKEKLSQIEVFGYLERNLSKQGFHFALLALSTADLRKKKKKIAAKKKDLSGKLRK